MEYWGGGGMSIAPFAFPITKHTYIDGRRYSSHKMVSLCRFHHSHVLTSHCHRKFAQLDPQKSSDIQAWVGPPRDPRGGTSASDQQRAMDQMGLFRQYKRSPLQCRGESVNAAFPLFGPCFLWPWICRLECCIVPFLCKSDIGGIFMLVVSSGFFFPLNKISV